MRRRFQFSLGTLFWAMFIVAVISGSWQIVRYWSSADPIETAYVVAAISVYIVVFAYAVVRYLDTPLDD